MAGEPVMGVFLADEQKTGVDIAGLRGLAESVLRAEGYPPTAEVTILLVDEPEMKAYNERFLERSGPTDVLAFPVEETRPGEVPDNSPDGPPLILGDVIIAPAYVARQAEELGVGFADEMGLMAVHGVLHLMGYDHQDDAEAQVMEAKEARILDEAGLRRR